MAAVKGETETEEETNHIKAEMNGQSGQNVHLSTEMGKTGGVIKQEAPNDQEYETDTDDQKIVIKQERFEWRNVEDTTAFVPAAAAALKGGDSQESCVTEEGVYSMEVAGEETVSQEGAQGEAEGLTVEEHAALTSLLTEHLRPSVAGASRQSGRKRRAKVIRLPGEPSSGTQARGRGAGKKKGQRKLSTTQSSTEPANEKQPNIKAARSSEKRVNLLRSGSKRRREEEERRKEAERAFEEWRRNRARAKRKEKKRKVKEKVEKLSDSDGEDQSAGIVIPPDRVCELCGKQVMSAAAYIGHIQMHNRHQNCPKCKVAFPNEPMHPARCCKQPKTHRRSYDCRTCGKSFRSELGREKHEVAHWAPKKFECRFCERKFATKIGCFQHSMTCFKKAAY